MSWIDVIPYNKASGTLKKLYNRVKGPNNNVDNIMLAHSLRPHTMSGHMALYKNVLHNSNNTLPKWFLETIGVYVSILNKCDYCVAHHSKGLKRLLNDNQKFNQIQLNLQSEQFCEIFEYKYEMALNYAKLLTLNPFLVSKNEIDLLLKEGFTSGEVLEINQVTAYFNYANRTVLGLGVTTEGDILGLSPNNSSEENNWNHQ
ncbi:carboxymuconolactone decarboxylase family protein [Lutibacter holmesii]|uniref:Carboxymuconolactone decarboxylase family protein n=1 Tax=Lutibacter holmesii TaxID=1137985 RepID=A0ABW3WQC5_9FLAO